jgi:hypothetical protein
MIVRYNSQSEQSGWTHSFPQLDFVFSCLLQHMVVSLREMATELSCMRSRILMLGPGYFRESNVQTWLQPHHKAAVLGTGLCTEAQWQNHWRSLFWKLWTSPPGIWADAWQGGCLTGHLVNHTNYTSPRRTTVIQRVEVLRTPWIKLTSLF